MKVVYLLLCLVGFASGSEVVRELVEDFYGAEGVVLLELGGEKKVVSQKVFKVGVGEKEVVERWGELVKRRFHARFMGDWGQGGAEKVEVYVFFYRDAVGDKEEWVWRLDGKKWMRWGGGVWVDHGVPRGVEPFGEVVQGLKVLEGKKVFEDLRKGVFGQSEAELDLLWLGRLFDAEHGFWSKQIIEYLPRAKMERGEGLAGEVWRYVVADIHRVDSKLSPKTLEAAYEVFEKFGSVGLMERVKEVTRSWYWKYRGEEEQPGFYPVLERKFVRYLGGDPLGGGACSRIRVVLEMGLEVKDEGMLDRAFVVMGEGESVAHLPLVGWFLSTEYCVKGGVEELKRVFDCLAKREEREVVWLVAGLLGHGDAGVVKEARAFLVKRVGEDLGAEVKAWRDWVKAG